MEPKIQEWKHAVPKLSNTAIKTLVKNEVTPSIVLKFQSNRPLTIFLTDRVNGNLSAGAIQILNNYWQDKYEQRQEQQRQEQQGEGIDTFDGYTTNLKTTTLMSTDETDLTIPDDVSQLYMFGTGIHYYAPGISYTCYDISKVKTINGIPKKKAIQQFQDKFANDDKNGIMIKT